jgi:hypothetical protein
MTTFLKLLFIIFLTCSSKNSFLNGYALLDEANSEVENAQDYKEQLNLFDKFKYAKLSKSEIQKIIKKIDEGTLSKLAKLIDKVDEDYIVKIRRVGKNLNYYKTKLPKRIRALERERNKEKYEDIIDSMQKLVVAIDLLIPKFEFFEQYLTKHRTYFNLSSVIDMFSSSYKKEINMFRKLVQEEAVIKIKRCARSKFSCCSTYPLIKYVKNLDSDILQLKKSINHLAFKYPELMNKAAHLKNYLFHVRSYVLGDREYLGEQRRLEDERAQAALVGAISGLTAATIVSSACDDREDKKDYVEEVVVIDEGR